MNDAPDIHTVTITELGFGGDGIAREGDETIFVPYGMPGDVVRVKITSRKDRQVWGRILDIIKPSPDRLSRPPCTHCFDCGGCQLQQMSLQAYQTWKYQTVIDRLEKGGLRAQIVHPLVAVPSKTRRRATFCARREGRKVIVGFNRHHSDQVIDLHECHVVVDEIFNILPSLRILMDVLMDQTRQADVSVTLLDTGLDLLITGDIELNLIKQEALAEFVQSQSVARLGLRKNDRTETEVVLQPRITQITVGGMPIDPAPGSFLQPSREGEQALIDAVRGGIGDVDQVIDLFSGLGTFTFPLAAAGMRVLGVDADGPGIRAAGRAVKNKNLTFQTRNLYREPVRAAELAKFDAVVFDPPRAGAKGQAPEIALSGVKTIVAVSCNPGTFVTDCVPFLDAGYRFTDLHVVDQFIWSSHVELVGVFKKFPNG